MLAIPFSAVASTEEGRSSAVGLASGGISPVEATVADDGAASVSAMTSDQRGRACSPAVCEALNRGRSWGGWERFHSPWVGRNGWGNGPGPQPPAGSTVLGRGSLAYSIDSIRTATHLSSGRSGWLLAAGCPTFHFFFFFVILNDFHWFETEQIPE